MHGGREGRLCAAPPRCVLTVPCPPRASTLDPAPAVWHTIAHIPFRLRLPWIGWSCWPRPCLAWPTPTFSLSGRVASVRLARYRRLHGKVVRAVPDDRAHLQAARHEVPRGACRGARRWYTMRVHASSRLRIATCDVCVSMQMRCRQATYWMLRMAAAGHADCLRKALRVRCIAAKSLLAACCCDLPQ